MPVSKKRKKKGKPVRGRVASENLSGVTLQDLINVLAYQEYVQDGTIVRDDVKVTIPDEIPVNVEDADGNKRQVGTATPIPGDPEHVSISFTDPVAKAAITTIAGSDYSIAKNEEQE